MFVNNKLEKENVPKITKYYNTLESNWKHDTRQDKVKQNCANKKRQFESFSSLQCKIVVQFKHIGMHVKAIKMLIVTS